MCAGQRELRWRWSLGGIGGGGGFGGGGGGFGGGGYGGGGYGVAATAAVMAVVMVAAATWRRLRWWLSGRRLSQCRPLRDCGHGVRLRSMNGPAAAAAGVLPPPGDRSDRKIFGECVRHPILRRRAHSARDRESIEQHVADSGFAAGIRKHPEAAQGSGCSAAPGVDRSQDLFDRSNALHSPAT